MNAEISNRLEKSFENDRIIGGPIVEDRPLLAIAKMIASAMHDTGRHCAFASTFDPKVTAQWHQNPFAYNQAVQAANTILEAFRPDGKIAGPALHRGNPAAHLLEHMGIGFANGILESVARGAARTSGEIEKIAVIRDELGELRDRIKHLAVGGETDSREAWGPKKPGKKSKK